MNKKEHIVTIKKPEGSYTIIYGVHVLTQHPDDLPKGIDGLFLESGVHPWYHDITATIKDLKEHVQYKKLFEKAEKDRTPILLGDLNYKYNDYLLLIADNAFTAIQWIAGMRMLSGLLRKGRHREGQRKKSASQLGLQGITALWLLLPFASTVLRLGSHLFGVGERKSAALKKLSHRLHPETELLYLSVRNAVIAEKVEYFAKTLKDSAHIAIVLGAGHVGIEDMLKQSSEERLRYLSKYKTLLKKLAAEEYFYKLALVAFEGKRWKAKKEFEVDELKKILFS